jgi:transcriptional coactivator HFI1/ADA1
MRPEDMAMSTTPTLSSTTLPDLSLPKSASKPSTPRAPRIDIEPLYGAVKMAISDADWTLYKTSLSAFLLGNLNQEELSGRLDRIFSRAASSSSEAGGLSRAGLERAHNALVMGVYANVWRDAPEAGIASWVSSSDKLSGSVPKGTGDESEKRLKHEVMHISRRERKRLKTMHQGGGAGGSAFDFAPVDTVGGIMMEYHEARRIKLPDAGPAAQAGGYGKTSTYNSLYPSLSVRILTRTLLLTPPSRLGP